MEIDKLKIIQKHCYTELVYGRINKKLNTSLTKGETEKLIKKVLEDTPLKYYAKIGKNYYVTNTQQNIKITVNSNTFRIITVDKVLK